MEGVFWGTGAIRYEGFLTIEGFAPRFAEMNRLTATWRYFAKTGEELAVQALKDLREIVKALDI